jgi:hypothetical protein
MDWGCVEDRYCHFDWHHSVDIGRGCAALIRGWCRIREHLKDFNHVQETLLMRCKVLDFDSEREAGGFRLPITSNL